jgi:Mg-chelatase subunit ChlD
MSCSHDRIGYNIRMNTSLSIFAKALASENLSFSFNAKAETASFDVKSRHLVMPVWNVSETVQTMLIAHEISHALWTPYELSRTLLDEAETEGYNVEKLQRIANMIEDVRIEKLMKVKFPGTRRDFFLGYKEINDLDLFKFNEMDLKKIALIYRLNIHFKWGVLGFIDINLSAEEQEIADMVDNVVTFEQVMVLAKFLYGSPDSKGKKVEEDKAKNNGEGESEYGESEDMMEKGLRGTLSPKGQEFTSNTVVLTGLKDVNEQIISTDRLSESFFEKQYETHSIKEPDLASYRTFVRESDAFVRQLVAQFERKKAADEIRRERPKQTGQLNLDRLHQYKTHDDIFLSKIVKKDGKNHGIVFMLDFSGSMSQTIEHAYLQVLQLVWFCEKAKIPFEVFAFTDVAEHYLIPQDKCEKDENGFRKYRNQDDKLARTCKNAMQYGDSRLINLASSRDDAAKRERLLCMIYETYVANCRSQPNLLRLGGTPTVECIAVVSQFMKEWVTANNIQVPTLMVVTDGEPNGFQIKDSTDVCGQYSEEFSSVTVTNDILETVSRIKKSDYYSLSNDVIGTMLNSLRQKLNTRVVGMFVGDKTLSQGDFQKFCVVEQERVDAQEAYRTGKIKYERCSIDKSERYIAAMEAYKNEGCLIAHKDAFTGYDEFFLIKTPKIVKDEDAIVSSGGFTKVKNTFIKTMGKRAGSRVFLSRYVDIVSGQPLRKGADMLYSKKYIG